MVNKSGGNALKRKEPEWSPFNMRQYNLSILKPPIVNNKGQTTGTNKSSMSSFTSPAESLDLLRQNVQRSLNSELKNVISRYLEVFFKPGIENIRNNSGPDSVTEEHIHTMCRQILEEAKKMYPVHPSTPSPVCTNAFPGSDHGESNISDYHNVSGLQQSQVNSNSDGTKASLTSPPFSGIKRESDTDSEASSLSNASKKLKKSKTGPDGKIPSDSANSNHDDTSSNSTSPNKPKKPSGPSRKHVANWDLGKFTTDTLFIMGAKANKALGFAQTRGRLYVKHPGLFKYASDSDDKEWLSKNKLMPATGGRAYIMLLEDIEKLARDNKLNAEINYDDIKGFRVPDFILDKMKMYITTWKKQYAEEAQKSSATSRNRTQTSVSSNTQSSALMSPSTTNSSSSSINLPPLNPPPPVLPIHIQQAPQQQVQQPLLPQPLQQVSNSHNQQQNMNSYHMNRTPAVIYEPNLLTLSNNVQPSHDMPDMREYMQMDKNPPVYPGHSSQQQMPQMPNVSTANYTQSQHLDPIEQALSKGDWSNVSDRSLLQYALQSSRSIGLWDPQDSFDLIESATNGNLSGNMGESSPLLQISPDTGAHLAVPPLLPVSPELTAVMDQAFQYTDT